MADPSLSSSSAGPSTSYLFPSSTAAPPPPQAIQKDDYAAANQARQRFNKRGLFSSVSLPHIRLHRKESKSETRNISPSPSVIAELERSTAVPRDPPDLVALAEDPNLSAELDEDYDKDVYRWAILYENQRGVMVFSTPYYSPLTLLPLDPPPYTIPTATSSPRRNQPTVTLEDYPLPDGSWKWVSRAWMIDMRGDGQVQFDGFEYSRSFRNKKWGPNPGFMSHRGLVRRRRWIRLMLRPAQGRPDAETLSAFSAAGALSVLPEFEHHEEGATRPPSVMLTISDMSDDGRGVWKGDADDWSRCHVALRRLGRDGRKLELWASWLGLPNRQPLSRPASWSPAIVPVAKVDVPRVAAVASMEDVTSTDSGQTEADKLTADTGVSISKAPKDYLAAVIRAHGSDILSLFVYPDSRAKFLLLLGCAGLLPDIRAGMGASDSVQILDFWSYTQDLGADTEP